MNPSLFMAFIAKFFSVVVGKITEKWNDKKNEEALLFKTMLTEEYSADLKWGSTELNHSVVAADVVALDSSLPLKRRGTMSHATGTIPKMGMKLRKGEKDINDINTMIAKGTNEATIAAKLFDDASKVIKGIDIRTEIMFLQALSTGVTLIEDDENVGTGVRVDFGYLPEKTVHASIVWGASGYTPITDLRKMFDKAQAEGDAINHLFMSEKAFDQIRNSAEGKLLAATSANMVITDASLLPLPTRTNFKTVIEDEFSATLHIIKSRFKIENHDGSKKTVIPFAEANVIGAPDGIVGRLVYGTLAEETNPVNGVDYAKSGNSILVSKYSKTDPLEEFTASQSLRMPVIDGGSDMYMLHTDSTGVLTVTPTTMSFGNTKSSKTATVHTDSSLSTLTIASSESFCTVKRNKNTITVTCEANASTERTATVTITQGSETATIAVTQAAAATE